MNGSKWMIGCLLWLAAVGIAAADGGASRPVRVADLDLRSDAGVGALYVRLKEAAGAVCGLDEARGYAERQHARRCQAATLEVSMDEARSIIARAKKKKKMPETAYLSARAGEPPSP
jgi:UrcA family protein